MLELMNKQKIGTTLCLKRAHASGKQSTAFADCVRVKDGWSVVELKPCLKKVHNVTLYNSPDEVLANWDLD